MTVTLDLPPDLEARARAEARKRSQGVEEYLQDLIAGTIPTLSLDDEREHKRALLRVAADIGDEDEQRETFEYLKESVNADRLSDRMRFP